MFADDFRGASSFGRRGRRRLRGGLRRPADGWAPAGTIDLMLAAIARVHGAGVVTRNVADFEGVGLTIIDPWGG